MITKNDLPSYVIEALKAKRGSASILDVCKYVWAKHEKDIRSTDGLFYTWQYDIRWAATELRNSKIMKPAEVSPKGIWELA
jgi:hypothetical protein